MNSPSVVKSLDINDYTFRHALMRLELLMVDFLYFEASVKALHRGMVVDVPFAAQALAERILGKLLAIN